MSLLCSQCGQALEAAACGPVHATRKRLIEVHQSDCQLFEECPAKFKAIHIDHVSDTNQAATVGTACHRAIEQITRASAGAEEWMGLSSMQVARTAIGEMASEGLLFPAAQRDALAVMDAATGEGSRLRFFVQPDEQTVVEQRFMLDENFVATDVPSRAAYAGTLDRLSWWADGLVLVSDYKTKLKPLAQWEIADDFQANVYALGALRLFPEIRAVTVRFVLLRHGYWVEEVFVRGEPWEARTIDRLRANREARKRALELDEWPETLGKGCAHCPVQMKCATLRSAERQGSSVIAKLTPDEIARRREAMRGLADAYDDAARALVEASGEPIPLGNGSVLGPRVVEGHDLAFPYVHVLRELRELGMRPAMEFDLFRPRNGDVAGKVKEALFRMNPATAKDHFERLVEPVATTRFCVFWPDGKPKEEEV